MFVYTHEGRDMVFGVSEAVGCFLLTRASFFHLVGRTNSYGVRATCATFTARIVRLYGNNVSVGLAIVTLTCVRVRLRRRPMHGLSRRGERVTTCIDGTLSFMEGVRGFLTAPRIPPLVSTGGTARAATDLLR